MQLCSTEEKIKCHTKVSGLFLIRIVYFMVYLFTQRNEYSLIFNTIEFLFLC